MVDKKRKRLVNEFVQLAIRSKLKEAANCGKLFGEKSVQSIDQNTVLKKVVFFKDDKADWKKHLLVSSNFFEDSKDMEYIELEENYFLGVLMKYRKRRYYLFRIRGSV